MNVTNVDSIDKMLFNRMADRSDVVSQLRSSTPKELNQSAQNLLEDGFASLYRYSVRMKPDVSPDRYINRQLISEMMKLGEYDRLRSLTKGDEVSSVGALGAFKQLFDRLPKELLEQQREVEEQQKQLDDFLQNVEPGEELDEEVEDLKKALADQLQKLQDYAEEFGDGIRQAVRATVDQAIEDQEQAEQALNVSGYGDKGSNLPQADLNQKLEVAKALQQNPQLKYIFKLAGRMINIAEQKQREKVEYARQEVEGIEQGNDLPDVVPSEFLYYVDEEFESLFFSKYLDSNLTQYKLAGKDNRGKGPVIVAVDCSESMRGGKDLWSKAIALAMYSIARRQKRGFLIQLFNVGVFDSLYIAPDDPQPNKLFKVLSRGCVGGTSFDAVLHQALNRIQNNLPEADFIMVSDGEAPTPDLTRWFETKEKLQFNAYGIAIGFQPLEIGKFADEVITLKDLGDEGEAFEKVFTI